LSIASPRVIRVPHILGEGHSWQSAITLPRGPTRIMTEHVPDERLAAYSKGRLGEPQLGEVEEHLLVCERCRARLTEFDNEWGLNG
jgi:hypothetical protein